MAVRKRTWMAGAEQKSAWVVNYRGQDGKRHQDTFARKKDADARWLEVGHELREGTHVARSSSITVAEAAEQWLQAGKLNNLERSTLAQYHSHVTHHIVPLIGRVKLSDLSSPRVQRFADDLLAQANIRDGDVTVSRSTARKVLVSLKQLLRHAQRQGTISKDPARPISIKVPKRGTTKICAGRDFPSKAEINAMLAAVSGRWRPLIVTAVFTGMRSSELRGLRWGDVDIKAGVIHVRQRADAWGAMGTPKSEAGERSIPMTPMVANTLREWRLTCPHRDRGKKGESDPGVLDLVFPTTLGGVENHANMLHRGFHPLQVACGMTRPTGRKDANGRPIMRAKYGLHTLRHFFASWLIDQNFSLKRVQGMLGHATLAMTADTYGHLFPDLENDAAKMAEGGRELLG